MRLLAIDPGNTESALVLYEPTGERIVSFAKESNARLLQRIPDIEADMMALEQIASYGMAVGETVFETVFWSGRFAQAWVAHGHCQFARIKRMEVKMHLCRSPRAKDCNIRQALIDRFGAPGTKKQPGKTYGITKDVWAALAVAVTFADSLEKACEVVK